MFHNSIKLKFVTGNEQLALQSFDPLKLDKLSIVQPDNSPVNIRLNLRNITVTGIKDIVVSKVVLVDPLLSYCSHCIWHLWQIISKFGARFFVFVFVVVLQKIRKYQNLKLLQKRKGSFLLENTTFKAKFLSYQSPEMGMAVNVFFVTILLIYWFCVCLTYFLCLLFLLCGNGQTCQSYFR